MASEPIRHLQKVLKTFSPASAQADGAFLPTKLSYPFLFSNGDNGKSMALALHGATGTDMADLDRIRKETHMAADELQAVLENESHVDADLYQSVSAEFYPMAADLEVAFDSLGRAIDGPDGLATTANAFVGSSESHRGLLASSTAALAAHHRATFESGEGEATPPTLDPQLFTSLRELKTHVTVIGRALGNLAALEKGDGWTKFNTHKGLFSPPYGENGRILSENLNKVTAWYMNHKRNRELLSEAHQQGLTALSEDEFFKSDGCPEWTRYSFEYFQRNPEAFYNVMDTIWLKQIATVDWQVGEAFKKGLAPFVANVEPAYVVDGRVKYPEATQNAAVFERLMNDAYAEDGLTYRYFDSALKLAMTAAMQESLRNAMVNEAKVERARQAPSEVFQKLCRCQQASYAAAAELGNGMTRLMSYIDDTLRPDVLDMTSTLDDVYCNLIVEDFESALEDYTAFGAAYEKFRGDLDSFYGIFRSG